VLIATALAIFAEWQFGLSLESLVLGPARDRIVAVANAIGRDLDATPYAERGGVLASYSQRYGVEFFLVNPDGGPLAGDAVELPPPVLERMRGQPGGGRGAPRRRGQSRASRSPMSAATNLPLRLRPLRLHRLLHGGRERCGLTRNSSQ
jgi:hypothetical protein